MSIESVIKSRLDAYAGLSALISTRTYNTRMPQNPTYPNIVFSRISTEPGTTLGTRNNLTNMRFSFEVRAETISAKLNVITQLKAALETASFTAIYIGQQDVPYESDVEIYRTDVDFSLWYLDI